MQALDRFRKAIEIGMRPDERKELLQIERSVKELEDAELLLERPAIMRLLQWCRSNVRDLNEQLSTDEELMKDGLEGTRLAMLKKKEILLYFIGLFDTKAQLEEIAKDLDDRSTAFEDYQQDR